jgi:hypothetical protein
VNHALAVNAVAGQASSSPPVGKDVRTNDFRRRLDRQLSEIVLRILYGDRIGFGASRSIGLTGGRVVLSWSVE